jgi:hypothetical protein
VKRVKAKKAQTTKKIPAKKGLTPKRTQTRGDQRRSPRLLRSKSSSTISLEELMKWGLIGIHDEVHYLEEVSRE